MSGTASFAIVGRRAQRALELRAFAVGEVQAQAHRVGHGEDVGEQDRGVQREARQRLQRDFAGHLRVLGQARKLPALACGWRGTPAGSDRPGASARPGVQSTGSRAGRAGSGRSSFRLAGCVRALREHQLEAALQLRVAGRFQRG
jgi:hypothetical protein